MTDSGLRPLRPSQVSGGVKDENKHTNNGDAAGRTPPTGSGPVSSSQPLVSHTKRATCSQCRIRKVRCDGRERLCRNCDRLGFECSFQQSPGRTPGNYALKLPERRRRMQACVQCHLKKTRCHGELPSCSSCVRKGLDCTYPPATRRTGTPPGSGSASGHQSSSRDDPPSPDVDMAEAGGANLLDDQTAMGQIEDYFRHLHPLPSFAFLHRPTVVRRCRDGTINEPLKLAICAITSLHLQRSALCHDLWVQQAEQLILQQIGQPSIFHLQALLLIVRYRIESGEFPTAFMLAALAARTAVALRLNYERSELTFVAQEARRRLYWALYLLDDYFCVGLREFELCPEETVYLQLPCREDIFEAGQQCQTGILRPSPADNVSAMGLPGIFMRLTSARRAIMRFNRRVGLGEESSATIGARIQQIEHDLSTLYSAISPRNQYSVANLALCEFPAQFVMLHMSYHQCHCDLYRMFLNGYSEAAPNTLLSLVPPQDRIAMQSKCLEHAEDILKILSDFITHMSNPSSSPAAPDVHSPARSILLERDAAVCAFESARLVLFGSRLPISTCTLEVALQKARAISLHLITTFFPYSASTKPLRTDLEHLIHSYSVRLATQPTTRGLSEGLSEPAVPRAASKVSQYANSRQRLSVQSLLLQSDFADDSQEIAGGGPDSASARTPSASMGTGNGGERQSGREGRDSSASSATMPDYVNGTSATSQAQVATTSAATTLPPTIDAGQEDAGLIFNPWMGFTGSEDIYGMGVPGRLDDDY
ncbi:hypothetical protein F5Y18DRAFT_440542 [Xylariaceae sp. FL1019]|nr:hypothetical protein F5Y18DRAFT_440542 [Xylariaceae sp. FL1019]